MSDLWPNVRRETVDLYESMTTEELIRLRSAFQLDMRDATRSETIAFGTVRLTMIDVILARRNAP